MDLDEQAIIDVLSMLLGAGADTISAYMQQFLKAMALHPETVAKAQAGEFTVTPHLRKTLMLCRGARARRSHWC